LFNTKLFYTHVYDIVHGIINALEKLDEFNIYNLGESTTFFLIDLIRMLEKYTGEKPK